MLGIARLLDLDLLHEWQMTIRYGGGPKYRGEANKAKADAPAPAGSQSADPKKVEEPAATPKTDATAEPAAEPPVQASGAKADAEEVSSQKGDAPKAEVPVEQKIQEAPVQAEEVPIEQKVQEAPAEAAIALIPRVPGLEDVNP
ncbi:unnamed protein product [Effrenium voratum]|uniref:Uncharacterized protein n=1 Tax=Effrenium voratum TaxID=2562239 RepID=A0AA36J676_9DINO|nr:unnamed protein product [Effrenium voratum]